MKTKLVTPGEVLLKKFMEPNEISQHRLSRGAGLSLSTVNQVIKGKRTITAYTALSLAMYFQNTPQFWMNLQSDYDLHVAKQKQASEKTR